VPVRFEAHVTCDVALCGNTVTIEYDGMGYKSQLRSLRWHADKRGIICPIHEVPTDPYGNLRGVVRTQRITLQHERVRV